MPNQHHAEGLSRAMAKEHDNQHQGKIGGKGPVKSFPNKGVASNPSAGGGINRKLKPTHQH